MLNIFFGDMTDNDKYLENPEVYFDNTYEDRWFDDEEVKEMVKDIDNSNVVSSHLIESPVFGGMPVRDLSGGVKTLILMKFDNEHIVNASYCGDNCAKWILRIAKEKDLTIRLGYLMDFGDGLINVKVANSGKKFDNCKDLFLEAIDYL
ncbi:MAG: DUF4869 domain-containing protein [Lachnospiraceae bacterium]|nr:DUF4869 domain-containing protein [Lachnospiraceae bacterium]